jgi:hypothetical protein
MRATIYINRHIVARNKKAIAENPNYQEEAAIAIRTYKKTVYGKEVDFARCKLIQDSSRARCSGATIWIEVDNAEDLVVDGDRPFAQPSKVES